MKKIFLIFILISIPFFLCAINKRALIIGIGDYPTNSGWSKINGDKDVPLVEEILLDNGFARQNIVKLINQQATYIEIKRQFERLISVSTIGDYIYIHFSGHGQQITDLNGDEDDGYDEAWIPYDAKFAFEKGSYEGQNHLIDDEINMYLHQLREKIGNEGKLIVVADACHSGGATKGDDESINLVVRGSADRFEITNAKKTNKAVSYPIRWTFISACKSHQSNYEYQGKGSLTFALYQQKTNFSTLSSKQITQNVKSCIRTIIPFTQTPSLEIPEGTENDIFL